MNEGMTVRATAVEHSEAKYKGVVECEVCGFRQAGIYDDKDTAEQSVKRWAKGHEDSTMAHRVTKGVKLCQE